MPGAAWNHGTECPVKQWCDILQADTAAVLARYNGDYFQGAAAVTRNAYHKGQVYYIGAVGAQALYNRMARMAAEGTNLQILDDLPPSVEVSTRQGNEVSAQFIFNNDDKPKHFRLNNQEISLDPFEMKILMR